jgi:hypothetical protein
MALPAASQHIQGWAERDPLTALLLNPELWVFDALESAIRFRDISAVRGFQGELSPLDMIELVTPKISTEMPPAPISD